VTVSRGNTLTRLPLRLLAAVCLSVLPASAQFPSSPGAAALQNSPVLKPPAGARVAIVEFADLECPACALHNPALRDAAAQYHVPWMRHDFPLPQHNWSFGAAVNARWFDSQSPKLGNDYRDAVFANQAQISTPDDLRSFTEKFAQAHKVALPFVLDPEGKLAAAVKADGQLGQSLGIHQTPTVWIVTRDSHQPGQPFIEVKDFNQLSTYLDQAEDATKGAATRSPARR
jgi:protein-disulfide isomerase